MDDEPPIVIRTAPVRRRRGHFVGTSTYLRRRRKTNLGRFAVAWTFGGMFGCVVGYLVVFYGFDQDPFGLRQFLPKIEVEWPVAPRVPELPR
jgi:hypothetical protein